VQVLAAARADTSSATGTGFRRGAFVPRVQRLMNVADQVQTT